MNNNNKNGLFHRDKLNKIFQTFYDNFQKA